MCIRDRFKPLQLSKILLTLLRPQRTAVVANEVADVKVADTNEVVAAKVADTGAGLMTPASRPAQPCKANFQSCQSALHVILLGAETTYLRCSHHHAATYRQSAKPSAVHCWVAGLVIKVRLEVF